VTPVLMSEPLIIVWWPTLTPDTSVMALSGPVSNTPIFNPRSRARGRTSWPLRLEKSKPWETKIKIGTNFIISPWN